MLRVAGLVMKVEGGSNGVGVVRVDSYAVLFALMDYFEGQGCQPLLTHRLSPVNSSPAC